MTYQDWAPPAIAFGALCLSMAAPHARDRKMLLLHAGANYAWGLYFVLFGAQTAVAISALAGTNMVVCACMTNQPIARQRQVGWLFMALNVVALFLTWQGLHSLIPFAAVSLGAYSSSFLRYERLRIGIACCILAWGLNALYFRAWEGVASCLLQLISQLMGLRRARFERLRDVRLARQMSRAA